MVSGSLFWLLSLSRVTINNRGKEMDSGQDFKTFSLLLFESWNYWTFKIFCCFVVWFLVRRTILPRTMFLWVLKRMLKKHLDLKVLRICSRTMKWHCGPKSGQSVAFQPNVNYFVQISNLILCLNLRVISGSDIIEVASFGDDLCIWLSLRL